MTIRRRDCLVLLSAGVCRAGETPLLDQWREIARETDGTVGVSALNLGSGRRLSLNGGERFPMASVCKPPIAAHILAMVAEGKLSLAGEIDIPVYDVYPGVSEVADRWPKQKRFPLDELLQLMVAKSDNTAVQTLYRIGGESLAIMDRLRQWGIHGIRIDRSERVCNLENYGVKDIPPLAKWTPDMSERLIAKVPPRERIAARRRFLADPRDTATPDGTVQLLRRLFQGELLAPKLTARLIEILRSTTTGEARIKGLLPAGTVVAHKTGTTTTIQGLNGATNDAGVITLPGNRGQLALAVFVKASTRSQAVRESVIAQIAKAAFESDLA